jgi:adenosylhomocysteine nucleosidase
VPDVLILAALAQEADAVFPGQGERLEQMHVPLRHVQLPQGNIYIATCGLGKVNAALAVGRLTNAQTRLVAMTGTCGRIAALEGNCYWITRAVQHDYGALSAIGFTTYSAGAWPMGEPDDPAFHAIEDPSLGLPHAAIASGDMFLECPDTAARLAVKLDVQLVDMEVAAVAQAATALNLPWAAIKAVTDDANGESAGDFMANVIAASSRAGKAMEQLALLTLKSA